MTDELTLKIPVTQDQIHPVATELTARITAVRQELTQLQGALAFVQSSCVHDYTASRGSSTCKHCLRYCPSSD